MSTLETLLDSNEAAVAIGVRGKTLNVWRARRKPDQPPYLKVGRLVRYRPSDLTAWLSRREQNRMNPM